MATKVTTFIVSTLAAHNSFVGFLDMLRYDAAKVVNQDSTLITLITLGNAPTARRWASFGIHVLAQASNSRSGYVDEGALRAQAREKIPVPRAPRLPGVPNESICRCLHPLVAMHPQAGGCTVPTCFCKRFEDANRPSVPSAEQAASDQAQRSWGL